MIRLYQQLPEGWDRDCLDLFLFSFHACGLRISDLVTLEWRHLNLKGAVLSKVLVKTKAVLSIPLSAPALEILGRWKAAVPDKPVMSGLFICREWKRKVELEDPEQSGLIPSEMGTAVKGARDAGAAGICLFTPGSMTPEHWEALAEALK